MLGHFFIRTKQHHHLLTGFHTATLDTTDANATGVGVVVQSGNLQLQWRILIRFGSRNMLQHGLEQRGHVFARGIQFHGSPAIQARGIYDGEVHLFVRCAKLVEQIKCQIDGIARISAITVNFVDDNNRVQAQGQRFLGDKAGLRHGAFNRIHQQQHAIDHPQNTFDFAAKVSVAGRIDNVDVHAVVFHGSILGKNGNAALFFQIIRVHDSFGQLLMCSKRPGLAKELVNQRGLAVVNVGNNGNVANSAAHGGTRIKKARHSNSPANRISLHSCDSASRIVVCLS